MEESLAARSCFIYGSPFFSWELQLLFCVRFFFPFLRRIPKWMYRSCGFSIVHHRSPCVSAFRTLFKNSWPAPETSKLAANNQTFYDLLFSLYTYISGILKATAGKKSFYYTPKSSNLSSILRNASISRAIPANIICSLKRGLKFMKVTDIKMKIERKKNSEGGERDKTRYVFVFN